MVTVCRALIPPRSAPPSLPGGRKPARRGTKWMAYPASAYRSWHFEKLFTVANILIILYLTARGHIKAHAMLRRATLPRAGGSPGPGNESSRHIILLLQGVREIASIMARSGMHTDE